MRLGGSVKAEAKDDDDDDEGGPNDDDLLADASRLMKQQQRQLPAMRGIGPSAFGSVTLSINRAQHHLFNYMENFAKRAHPMPRLGGKPSRH